VKSIQRLRFRRKVALLFRILEKNFFSETVVKRMVSKIPDDAIVSSIQNELCRHNKTILEYSGKIREIFEFSQAFF